MKTYFGALLLLPAAVFGQGSLVPPGAPGPTLKTLQQIEPRNPISALPFSINQPGAYYLTTNLIGSSGQNGITVAARNVTIDLNGFELAGVSAAASGIFVSTPQTNLVVHNGTVRNWPGLGLAVSNVVQGRYENLRLFSNGGGGISAGAGSLVAGCNLEANGAGSASVALRVASSGVVKNCTIRRSGGEGIRAGFGSSIIDCVIDSSGATGLFTDESCIVRGCAVTQAGLSGIDAGPANTIEASSSGFNDDAGILAAEGTIIRGTTVYANSSEGIFSSGGTLIEGCTVRANGGGGIDAGNHTTIQSCTVTTNMGHGIVGGTNVTVKNSVVTRSSRNGIQLDDNSIVAHCTSSLNSSNGIDVAVGCSVTESVANQNARYGIVANARCRVFGSTANQNGVYSSSGAGFYLLGDDNHVEANNAVRNFIGYMVDGGFNFIVRNKASDFFNAGFTLNVGTNHEGPIATDPLGTTHPWANFAF